MQNHLHEDTALFREAVTYTAARTGFLGRLVEKDYYCTVILDHLASSSPDLVFKGGTCLAKVHLGFFRMSEDLDFVIPVPAGVARAERSQRSKNPKRALEALHQAIPGLRIESPLTGSNNSTQYAGAISYTSVLGTRPESIKVEIGMREPLLRPHVRAAAHTLLLDPISGQRMIPTIDLTCIAPAEGLAEKLRAALTRRDPAIRDFYDIDHAIRGGSLEVTDPALLEMVRRKLTAPGNSPVDITANRLSVLTRQVDAQLRPVLRGPDFEAFDLGRAFATVEAIASAIAMS
jgi:predicted nucleotidyltransferase component of viral defense system